MIGRKPWVLWLIVGFSLIKLSLPTLFIVGASFTAGKIITFPPDGLSLKWYAAIANASDLRAAFLRSLYVATVCTLVAIPLGTLAGVALAKYRLRYEKTIQAIFTRPNATPYRKLAPARGRGMPKMTTATRRAAMAPPAADHAAPTRRNASR